jgi:hypothetical protein
MRTTITLDPDVEELIRRRMHERRATFKDVVNAGLRVALRTKAVAGGHETPTFDLGTPRADLDRALALAGALEDDERIRRLLAGR